MKTFIAEEIKQLGLNLCAISLEGLHVQQKNEELEKLKQNGVSRVIAEWNDKKLRANPILAEYRRLNAQFSPISRKVVPSAQTVIQQILRKKTFFSINTVVDLYNLISAESLLSIGAHDADKIDGSVTLRFTNGNEVYTPIGDNRARSIPKGEYAYVDESNYVICRMEVRQGEKTKVDFNTKNLLVLIQGNRMIFDHYLLRYATGLVELFLRFCGGEGEIIGLY